jgi:SAM-dependent methyltransferase
MVIESARWITRIAEPRDKLETAEEYIKLAEQFRESDQALAVKLAAIIPAEMTVVEIGPGPWNTGEHLIRKRGDLRYIGYDISQEMIDHARKKAEAANFTQEQVRFVKADMTQMAEEKTPSGLFVFSNTVIHERPDDPDAALLLATFRWIAAMVGDESEKGFAYIRDLRRPKDPQDAQRLRSQVVKDADLSDRELELFVQSQCATDTPEEVQRIIDQTSLKGRGAVYVPHHPNARYWIYKTSLCPPSKEEKFYER